MGLSASQEFMVLACRLAGAGDYFRWQEVGTSMGYTPQQTDELVSSLDQRKLLIRLQDGAARMLAKGKELASRMDGKLQKQGEALRGARGTRGR